MVRARTARVRVHLEGARIPHGGRPAIEPDVTRRCSRAADYRIAVLRDADLPRTSLEGVEREEVRSAVHADRDVPFHGTGRCELDERVIVPRQRFADVNPARVDRSDTRLAAGCAGRDRTHAATRSCGAPESAATMFVQNSRTAGARWPRSASVRAVQNRLG